MGIIDRFIRNNDIYTIKKINNTCIVIFDSHKMALPVWGVMSSILNVPLNLVSFDFHTDTHSPFAAAVCSNDPLGMSNYSTNHAVIKSILRNKKYKRNSFNFDDIADIAENNLRNDEHILTAVMFEYIKSYTIICAENAYTLSSYQDQDRYNGYNASYFSKNDISEIKLVVQSPVILDFDLDYFNSMDDFCSGFVELIIPLIKRAEVITIAREPHFFELCKVDNEYRVDEAMNTLLELLEKTLTVC